MIIRYDLVGDKLDLSRFIKRAPREIGQMRRMVYDFYVQGYKISFDIGTPDDITVHLVRFNIMEIKRDDAGEIQSYISLYPNEDLRFKEIPDIAKYFDPLGNAGHFESASVDNTVDILSKIVKVVYKINNLKAFL
jgi:hypothetical protein